MEDEDYRIMVLNNTTMKCFRDGRIFTLSKKCKKYEKWNELPSNPNNGGYIRVRIGEKVYQSHRLIMMAFVGESDKEVDHINRIKNDNRFENLRYVTRTENNWNRDFVENAKGYYWHHTKWRASIRINNKLITLGRFDNEQEARQAYLDACSKFRNEL